MMLDEPLPRSRYIGGHDAAAIMGMHPHLSRVDVWLKLTGRGPILDDPSPAMKRGQIYERGILEYVDANEKVLWRNARGDFSSFWLDDDVPFFGGSPDALCEDDDALYEVTTATTRTRASWGATGTDSCVKHKWIQCQWYLGITGRRRVFVRCLVIDTDEYLDYVVGRSEPSIEQLRDSAEQFYVDHVLSGVPPQYDLAAGDHQLQAIYPHARIPRVAATQEIVNAAQTYAMWRAAAKIAEDQKDLAARYLMAQIGEGKMASWNGGSVHWSASKLKPDVDWQEMAVTLARRAGMRDEQIAQVANGFVKARFGKRQLRVFVNEPQKDTKR